MRIKIIYNTPYTGMNSGWPTRFIGVIKELYKRNELFIFAPGDTSLLKSIFPNAWVCDSTKDQICTRKFSLPGLFMSMLFPKRDNIFLPTFNFYSDFNRILKIDSTNYDIVFYCGLSAFIQFGHYDKNIVKICDFCDSFLRHFISDFRMATKNNLRLRILFDMLYLIRIKRKFINNKLLILATTANDTKCIRRIINKNPFEVIPNGIYTSKLIDNDNYYLSKWQSNSLIFCGSLDYNPNFIAISYILQELWPLLKEKHPEIKFNIVGRNPTAKISSLIKNYKDAFIIPNVEYIEPYYHSAKIALSPMFSGGGIKNKILEALQTATPIITNNEGATGIAFISGAHGFIEENKADLLKAIEHVLDADYEIYKTWAKNCLNLSEQYNWNTIGERLDSIFLKHLNGISKMG